MRYLFTFIPILILVASLVVPVAMAGTTTATRLNESLVRTLSQIDSDYVSAVVAIDRNTPRDIVEQFYDKLANTKFTYYGLELNLAASRIITGRNGEYIIKIFGPRDLVSSIVKEARAPIVAGFVKPLAQTLPVSTEKAFDGAGASKEVEPNDYFVRWITGADVVNEYYGITGSNIVVAVVDTGIDYAHLFLQDKLIYWEGEYYDLDYELVTIREPLVLDADSSHVSILVQLSASGGLIYPPNRLPVITPSLVYVTVPYASYDVSQVPSQSGIYSFGVTYLSLVGATSPIIRGILLADPDVPGVYTKLYVDFNNNGVFGDTGDIVADYYGNRILAYPSLSNPTHSLGVAGGFFHDLGWWLSNGRVLPGWDLKGRYISIFYDFHMHGTACASAVGGVDVVYGGLMTGIAPGAKVIGVKSLWYGNTEMGQLWAAGFDVDPFTGVIYYTGTRRADIISNSWGISSFIYDITGFGFDYASALGTALTIPGFLDPNFPGIIVVQAAGNGGGGYGTVTSPGAAPGVITVGASTSFFPYVLLYGYRDVGWDQIIGWAARGPTPAGYLKPDVVNVGMGGFAAYPVGWGRGGYAYTVFSGTSYATPLTAGSIALILEALISTYGESARYVNPAVVKHLLMNTADYLGYPPLDQGAGRVNVLRAVEQVLYGDTELLISSTTYHSNIASKMSRIWLWYWLDYMPYNIYMWMGNLLLPPSASLPPEWSTNTYYGVYVPDIPRGSTRAFQFSITNPGGSTALVQLDVVRFVRIGAPVVYTVPLSLLRGYSDNSTYIILNSEDIPANAEIMEVEVNMPFRYFDGDLDYIQDYLLLVYAYVWVIDADGNGYPYNPAAANRPIQLNELVYLNYGLHDSNYNRLQIGRPRYWLSLYGEYYPMSKLVIRARFWNATDTTKGLPELVDVPINITITFYAIERDPNVRLTTSSLYIMPGRTVSIGGYITPPSTAAPTVYQSYIRVNSTKGVYYVPLTYTVVMSVSGETTFTLNPIDDTSVPYSPSRLRGENDWYWRYEAGDWRVFYINVTDPYILSLEVRAAWTYDNTSLVAYVFGPDLQLAGGFLGQSVSWHRHLGSGKFMWHATGGIGNLKSTIIFPSTRYRYYMYPTPKPNTGIYTIVVRTVLFDGSANLERFTLTVRGIRGSRLLPTSPMPPSGTASLGVKFPYATTEATIFADVAGLPAMVALPERDITTSGAYSGSFPPNYVFTFNITWVDLSGSTDRADISAIVVLNAPQLPVMSRRGTSLYTNTTYYYIEDWIITGYQWNWQLP